MADFQVRAWSVQRSHLNLLQRLNNVGSVAGILHTHLIIHNITISSLGDFVFANNLEGVFSTALQLVNAFHYS